MNPITVDKEALRATLQKNRDEHRTIFEKAQDVYRQQMVAELDRALDDAKNGRKIRRVFSLPVPEDFTAEFDTAIEMLEWALGETIELDPRDFQQYVQNQWSWNDRFVASTTSYLAE